ncbi:unnamed protein product [Linum trigynum]|uniref:Uncharacterized protein n=1 Tax=Linum trigynum TaxID=586398 RepID=A0AAV2FDV9_9ROSI
MTRPSTRQKTKKTRQWFKRAAQVPLPVSGHVLYGITPYAKRGVYPPRPWKDMWPKGFDGGTGRSITSLSISADIKSSHLSTDAGMLSTRLSDGSSM